MSPDMLMTKKQIAMDERKQDILEEAIRIIASEGYSKLTMRALARASGMKLGALQYHFRTWEDMLHALAAYIGVTYRQSFDAMSSEAGPLGLTETVLFILDDTAGSSLRADQLFPQLWAMAKVEPVMAILLDDIYVEYLEILKKRLVKLKSSSPHAEALMLMSLIEGSTLFVGRDCRWAKDAKAMRKAVLEMIETRYGDHS